MNFAPDTILIALNDTSENLEWIRKFIREKNLDSDDVKIVRRDKLLQLRTKREVSYG